MDHRRHQEDHRRRYQSLHQTSLWNGLKSLRNPSSYDCYGGVLLLLCNEPLGYHPRNNYPVVVSHTGMILRDAADVDPAVRKGDV